MLSETGSYHITFRGVNHCQLFEEDEDFEKLLSLLVKVRTELSFEIHAYCLMDNHAHLLIRERSQRDIITIMRKTLTAYAGWFNKKYERSGALITNRYKSECVTNDAYLLTVVRYIHHNPVKAGIVSSPASYRWSSYHDYLSGQPGLTDTDFVLTMFAADHTEAVQRMQQFHADDPADNEIRLPQDRKRTRDPQIREELALQYPGLEPHTITSLPRPQRNLVLAFLKERGFSIRQIERVTGVPRGIVTRARSTSHPET